MIMVSREGSIGDAVKAILALPGSDNIEFISLFGSVSQHKSHSGSDIDICIYYEGAEKEALNFLLRAMFSINSSTFDLKLFRELPLYIRIDVLKGRILYSKELSRVYEIAHETMREYEDFEPRFYDYIGKEEIH